MIKKISIVTVALVAAMPFIASAETFNRQLQLGMRGTDVGVLQTFLANDVTLYPQGLITSYFGSMTKTAVAKFQVKNGLPAVGRVGPATLPILNSQVGGSSVSDTSASIITATTVSTSNTTSIISWNTNELAKGVVYYSTSPLTTYERENSVDISGNTAMTDSSTRTTQSVGLSNLQSNTLYYYMIYSTDQSGNVSVTDQATFRTTN